MRWSVIVAMLVDAYIILIEATVLVGETNELFYLFPLILLVLIFIYYPILVASLLSPL